MSNLQDDLHRAMQLASGEFEFYELLDRAAARHPEYLQGVRDGINVLQKIHRDYFTLLLEQQSKRLGINDNG